MHHLKLFAKNCHFEWWNNCVQCWFPKWLWMVGQLIQNLVWIFQNGTCSTVSTKPCLDTSKWWINGPSKTIWIDLNGSTACYNTFLKVEILNGFKWSISRRVNKWCKYIYRLKWVNCFWLVKALTCIVDGGQNDSKNQSNMPLCAHLRRQSKQAVDWFWPL